MILFTKDSGGVVASVAALIATGWSDPLPGGLQLPLKNNAFSRRTGFSEAFGSSVCLEGETGNIHRSFDMDVTFSASCFGGLILSEAKVFLWLTMPPCPSH